MPPPKAAARGGPGGRKGGPVGGSWDEIPDFAEFQEDMWTRKELFDWVDGQDKIRDPDCPGNLPCAFSSLVHTWEPLEVYAARVAREERLRQLPGDAEGIDISEESGNPTNAEATAEDVEAQPSSEAEMTEPPVSWCVVKRVCVPSPPALERQPESVDTDPEIHAEHQRELRRYQDRLDMYRVPSGVVAEQTESPVHFLVASLLTCFSLPSFRHSIGPGQYLWELIGPKLPTENDAPAGPSTSSSKQILPIVSKNGLYVVKLFFQGTWRVVKVDDQVPLDADGKPLLPVFMGPNREIWLFLLLKAALKCCSSHIGVLYNDEQAVLGLLTGFQVRAMPVSPTHRLELKRRLLSWMHHKDQTFLLLSCRGPTVDESESAQETAGWLQEQGLGPSEPLAVLAVQRVRGTLLARVASPNLRWTGDYSYQDGDLWQADFEEEIGMCRQDRLEAPGVCRDYWIPVDTLCSTIRRVTWIILSEGVLSPLAMCDHSDLARLVQQDKDYQPKPALYVNCKRENPVTLFMSLSVALSGGPRDPPAQRLSPGLEQLCRLQVGEHWPELLSNSAICEGEGCVSITLSFSVSPGIHLFPFSVLANEHSFSLVVETLEDDGNEVEVQFEPLSVALSTHFGLHSTCLLFPVFGTTAPATGKNAAITSYPDSVGGKDASEMPQPWFRYHFSVPSELESILLGLECIFFQPKEGEGSGSGGRILNSEELEDLLQMIRMDVFSVEPCAPLEEGVGDQSTASRVGNDGRVHYPCALQQMPVSEFANNQHGYCLVVEGFNLEGQCPPNLHCCLRVTSSHPDMAHSLIPVKVPIMHGLEGQYSENKDHILFSYIVSAPTPTPLLAYLTVLPSDVQVGVRIREPKPKDVAKGKKKPEELLAELEAASEASCSNETIPWHCRMHGSSSFELPEVGGGDKKNPSRLLVEAVLLSGHSSGPSLDEGPFFRLRFYSNTDKLVTEINSEQSEYFDLVKSSWNSEKGRVEKAREARNRFLEAQNGEAQLRAISEGASGEAAEVEDANGTGLWSVDQQRQEVQRRAALAAEITESMTSEIAHCNETVETLITSCLEEKIFSAVDAGRRELQQHLAEELGARRSSYRESHIPPPPVEESRKAARKKK